MSTRSGQIGTDLFCLFCYKNILAESVSFESSSLELYSRFVKHLYQERSASQKEVFKDGNIPEDAGVGMCVDCQNVIGQYCKLYFELEQIQLKLQWQLEKLTCVMKIAGKVPSRLKVSLLKKMDGDTSNKLLDFRQNVIETCSNKSQRKFPRVILNRLDVKHQIVDELDDVELNASNHLPLDQLKNDLSVEHVTLGTTIIVNSILVKQENHESNVDELIEENDLDNIAEDDCFNEVLEDDNLDENDDVPAEAPVGNLDDTKLPDEEPERSSESIPPSSESIDCEANKQIDKVETNSRERISCSMDNCQESLKNETFLKLHLKLHGDFSCNSCEFKTNRGDVLMDHEFQKHSATHPDPNKVKCSRCERCFAKQNSVHAKTLKHFLGKHFGIEYTTDQKCPICGVGFSTSYRIDRRLREHIKNVHGTKEKPTESFFKCEICDAPFLTENSRMFHQRTMHKFSPRLECPECHKTWKKMRDLEYHVRHVHKNVEAAFKCSIPGCGKSFVEKLSLKGHMQKHRKRSEMLECCECSEKFMNEHALKQHMGKHQNQSNKSKGITKRTCTAVCELCGKVFSSFNISTANAKLKIHMNSKLHSEQAENGLADGWQFSCDTCGKLCQTQFKLDEHLRTHSKEKPFLCTRCGRDFSIRNNLKRHMKLVHKEKFLRERKKYRRTADCMIEDDNSEVQDDMEESV